MREYNPFDDRHFNVNRLEKNEITFRGRVYAKLPAMSDRVFKADCVPEDVHPEQKLEADDIAFLANRHIDEETGEIHDEVVIIGKDISFVLDGMMVVGKHYHEYFDTSGRLVVDPMKNRGERKAKCDSENGIGAGAQDDAGTVTAAGTNGWSEQLAEILKRKNRTQLGEKTVVRVPDIPGRIVRVRKEKDAVFIQLIYETWRDPKTGKPRNRKAFIGKMVEFNINAMYPNKRYEQFFDMETGELKHTFDDTPPGAVDGKKQAERETPEEMTRTDEEDMTAVPGTSDTDEVTDELIEKQLDEIIREADEMWKEEKRSRLQRAEEEERKKNRKELLDEGDEFEDEEYREAVALVEKMADEIRREEAGNGQTTGNGAESGKVTYSEEELRQKEAEMNEAFSEANREKERVAILKLILRGVHESIRIQARKRPDDVVNTYKVETTNSLLEEAKGYYEGTGYGDLLKLIPKPIEKVLDDGSVLLYGLSYSDVDLILSHYDTILRFIDVEQKEC